MGLKEAKAMEENNKNEFAAETSYEQQDAPEVTNDGKVPKKMKKIRNAALFKRGGYSVAVTAAVLAAIILLNVLVGALSDRVNLEYDISSSKNNSVSEENAEFIKGVNGEVSVTVCAAKEDYIGNYMLSFANQYYSVSDSKATEYFKQTVNIIDKYGALNRDFDISYVDTQDPSFTEISSKYANEELNYGDIIVSSSAAGTQRHRIIKFSDVYELADESGYAAYGYGYYTIGSNNIETALTSAVAYVISSETKKTALLTGHSSADYTTDFVSVLRNNNYETEAVSDSMITSVSDEFDAVVIAAPTVDFMDSELEALSRFLENGGSYGKGILYFADASNPHLPNLSGFLSKYGIIEEEGILFQTDSRYHTEESPATMGIYPTGEDGITESMNYCITGYNVPLKISSETPDGVTLTEILKTAEGAVKAPLGASSDWTGYTDEDKGVYSGLIQAKISSDEAESESYIMAFGSVEYIMSEWTEYSNLDNMDIALLSAERASGADSSAYSFVAKKITDESYADSVTASGTALVRFIFMFLLPAAVIIAGIYVYIRRRNA